VGMSAVMVIVNPIFNSYRLALSKLLLRLEVSRRFPTSAVKNEGGTASTSSNKLGVQAKQKRKGLQILGRTKSNEVEAKIAQSVSLEPNDDA
jgi:hypothetical protein